LLWQSGFPVTVFTLDTGRLFPETYSTWRATLELYALPIHAFYPDEVQLRQWVTENGPSAFYNSTDQRKACCHIRKVVPLERALTGRKLWITGIRAEQSQERQQTPILEWDDAYQILKYHPCPGDQRIL